MANDDKHPGEQTDGDKPNEAATGHQSMKRALTAGTGEVYTVRKGDSSLTIGRADPLPSQDDDDLDDSIYPEVPKGESDYDTWLG
jgi:hypothetical protein